MKKAFSFLVHCFWVALLTLLTQTGGLVWLATLPLSGVLLRRRLPGIRGLRAITFILLYTLTTIAIIPPLAQHYGRVQLPVFGNPHLKPENLLFCFFNRNYVRPALRAALEDAAKGMQECYSGAIVWYMDANFPFVDGYPLEPHFSHKDGKKVDLSFFWTETQSGKTHAGNPSPYGYGVCAEPLPGEYDYAADCEKKGFWYISLDRDLAKPFYKKENYTFDADRTRELLRLLAERPDVSKILIQPHLEKRLKLEHYNKMRAQGCKAARHDDHVHVELQ